MVVSFYAFLSQSWNKKYLSIINKVYKGFWFPFLVNLHRNQDLRMYGVCSLCTVSLCLNSYTNFYLSSICYLPYVWGWVGDWAIPSCSQRFFLALSSGITPSSALWPYVVLRSAACKTFVLPLYYLYGLSPIVF